ncbi:glycosyltransferase [Novipirellula artificiosorum]|uniref:D-inositol-3-phosphate glycosyltransferase n=1 Tax=Novipirellula artificiosorum TaxID=2528016 RepID=A0A5C6DGT4_9BACT|nr:glycosyltransferase [Novipirellula artificiosorum]TWU34941.1 D-inositol-3-phosphate glycosyltransferase [Novipirellula artificiosorum]
MRVLMICPELPRLESPGTMAPGARQIESLRRLGLSIDVVDMRGIPKLKYLQVIPRIRRLVRDVDVIHAHFGYCGWLGYLAPVLTRPRKPLVVSFMGSDLLGSPYNVQGDLHRFSKFMVRINKKLAWKASRVIVKSAEMAGVIAPAPSVVIPNGVDVELFRPIDRVSARTELGLPLDRKLVLFPGNPDDPRKNHALAAEATRIASSISDQSIDLVPLWRVQPEQVAVYMNACDVMVMTSLLEGSPNVVKEAMACNTPVVGVPVGDVEQLLEGVEGCEFCSRDPNEVGDAILRAFQAPHVAARESILERGLDSESVARRISTVYEQALGDD